MFEWIYISILIFLGLLVARIIFMIIRIQRNKPKILSCCPAKTVICIGSGGHTTEMLRLIEKINPELYHPRIYIMARNDVVSESKIYNFERTVYKNSAGFNILKIPRSREVNQSYVSSAFTTVKSTVYCIPLLFNIRPDLILCNGPGTCVPICIIAFLLKVLFVCDTKIVFIESICRVESLSLSGLILNFFADHIVVQWKELTRVCKRADYLGQLF